MWSKRALVSNYELEKSLSVVIAINHLVETEEHPFSLGLKHLLNQNDLYPLCRSVWMSFFSRKIQLLGR